MWIQPKGNKMNREHKYKIWNKTFKTMSKPISVFEHGKRQIDEYYREEEIEFIQYTGLKDKNGIETYEGDIIELGPRTYDLNLQSGDRVTIDWDGDKVAFKPFSTGHSDYDRIDDFEVIGNIYQNPELLEDQQ